MPAGQHGGQQQLGGFVLADDRLARFAQYPPGQIGNLVELRGRCRGAEPGHASR
jgi:hypothetical protein